MLPLNRNCIIIQTYLTICICNYSDDLAYAHAVINTFRVENGTEILPIHLARVSCPAGAQSLNDCRLGDGWGAVRGCSHALDVGVFCGPDPSLTSTRMRKSFFTAFFMFLFLISMLSPLYRLFIDRSTIFPCRKIMDRSIDRYRLGYVNEMAVESFDSNAPH